MGVSKNNGTPKSSILIGFSIIYHPFWGTPIFGNTHIDIYIYRQGKWKETRVSFGWHDLSRRPTNRLPTIKSMFQLNHGVEHYIESIVIYSTRKMFEIIPHTYFVLGLI